MMNPTLLAVIAVISTLIPFAALGAQEPETKEVYTSFQTPTEYRAVNDIRTDAVIVYSDIKERIQSWKDNGYVVQTMYGFRTGYEYIQQHKEEAQTLADGTLHTCGPHSYYMVPTQSRIDAAIAFFKNAIEGGTSAVIPEEPEFFAKTGYSESFKQAWAQHYGEPWQDPTSSVAARYKSEKLKAWMEYNNVRAILEAAKKQKPNVIGMIACHSPVNYFGWGIIYPHYQCLTLPTLDEIIGQVWTGTARTPCAYEGVTAQRTFENAFLEYSSLYNLARGSGKRMWFLMDPLEDNPDRSMEDYHENYEKTLIASLLFPGVDAYEVMPWPTRIYGRVPDQFATEISTIINVLQDMHNQGRARFDMGTRGIATFVADSMGWQRGAPHKGSFDSFYGITLPLVAKGIPIEVAQLERVVEDGYLDDYRVLFVSYDLLKPMKPEYNQALADWVEAGGVLVFFGGTDAYNAVPEWWHDKGYDSPQADLYARMGVKGRLRSLTSDGAEFVELGRAAERFKQMENKRVQQFDLTRFARSGGPVYVRISDAYPDDGWGPNLRWVKLTVDGSDYDYFQVETVEEAEHMFVDGGSVYNGSARFADGDSYWIYKFKVPRGSHPLLEMQVGNQWVVEATDQPLSKSWTIKQSSPTALTQAFAMFDVPSRYPVTLCKAMMGGIYRVPEEMGSAMFQRHVGDGTLIHVGIAPAYFASSAEAADVLRAIAAHACEQAGIKYEEHKRFGIRRGKYVAMHTLEGEKELTGTYVDLLDPTVSLVTDPKMGPGERALYCDVTSELQGEPKLLYASSKVESYSASADSLELSVTGPWKTTGVVRIYTGGKSIGSIQPESVEVEESGDTVLLSYPNTTKPFSIRIDWR